MFRRTFIKLLAAALLVLGSSGCALGAADDDVLVVGYLGGLSGRASSLGLAARDGALLAVEEANGRGGIAGRRVVLEVADDGAGATAAASGLRELHERGVVAVVGPVLSASAMEAVPVANELRVPLVAPVVSTGDLTGIDDFFVRVYPDNRWAGERLAQEMVQDRGFKRISVVYDLSNKAYTETAYLNFKEYAEMADASFVATATFTSGMNPDYSALAGVLIDSEPDCILLVANAIDTAMLCQRIRVQDPDVPIAATPWSATNDLISSGGEAVEGLMYLDTLDVSDATPDMTAVTDAFFERFGYVPGFSALHAYEAMRCILEVAHDDPRPEAIKRALVGQGSFDGLQGPIEIDRYGDASRPYFLMTVDSGAFRPVRR